MKPEIHDAHRWLARLAGKWNVTYAGSPEGENDEHHGVENVHILGDVWAICEGTIANPEGAPHTNIMTLGYDPARKRFVGSFFGSAMTNMWIYEGDLDASGKRLELMTEGPSYTSEGGTATYRDSIEIIGDDERTLTSEVLENGEWKHFMRATYRRVHE